MSKPMERKVYEIADLDRKERGIKENKEAYRKELEDQMEAEWMSTTMSLKLKNVEKTLI